MQEITTIAFSLLHWRPDEKRMKFMPFDSACPIPIKYSTYEVGLH